MLLLHIVRIRCEHLSQTSLFTKAREPADIVTDAIRGQPTANVGRGSEWHIGRTELLPEEGVAFQMGRTLAVTAPQFNIDTHSFFEAEVERAPYTVGVFDKKTQACGIIRKAGVSQNAYEISSKLEKLLNSTKYPEESGVRIVVDPIRDPDGFIEQLRSAAAITKFSFTASFPNPFDVNKLIQKPAEDFTKIVNGERTKIEVEGDNLDEEVLEELARGVASTGENASATVRTEGARRGKRIQLNGNPLSEALEENESSSLYQVILHSTRLAYDRIRNIVR